MLMFFVLDAPYSEFCADSLMMANCPKHVVKVKIKIYRCVSLKPETIFVLI